MQDTKPGKNIFLRGALDLALHIVLAAGSCMYEPIRRPEFGLYDDELFRGGMRESQASGLATAGGAESAVCVILPACPFVCPHRALAMRWFCRNSVNTQVGLMSCLAERTRIPRAISISCAVHL